MYRSDKMTGRLSAKGSLGLPFLQLPLLFSHSVI